MSNGKKSGTVKAKRGMVVNRKRNRTISQDVAASSPKWENVGGGILRLKGSEASTAYIGRHKATKFSSLTRKAVDIALAPSAPEMAAAAE